MRHASREFLYQGDTSDQADITRIAEAVCCEPGVWDYGFVEGWDIDRENWWPGRYKWLVEWRSSSDAAIGTCGESIAVHLRSTATVGKSEREVRKCVLDCVRAADLYQPVACGMIDVCDEAESSDGLHYLSRRAATLCRETNSWWLWENRHRLADVSMGVGWGTLLSASLVRRCGGVARIETELAMAPVFAGRTDLIELLPGGGCVALLSPFPADPVRNGSPRPDGGVTLGWVDASRRALRLRRLLTSVDAL